MLQAIEIGGIELPVYGLVSMVGFVLGIVVACIIAKKSPIPKQDVVFASFYCGMGLLVGAKLLYFITVLPKIITHIDLLFAEPFLVIMYAFSGFVFYGGLIGGALGIIIYCKQFHMPLHPFMNIAAPAIPLMHCLGRIACFLTGCCYGIEYHGPLAIQYPENTDIKGLADFERFPVQLVESAFNLILFIILFTYLRRKTPKPGRALGIYLTAYPIARFTLEFLRGDAIRGKFLLFTTSQWISLMLLPLGIYLLTKYIPKEYKCEQSSEQSNEQISE